MKITELIKRCQQQDPIAQELLYTKYSNQLYRTAYRYLKNQEEAEDVLIIALNKIFENINQFQLKEEQGFVAWMKKIVINEALMSLRKSYNFKLTESISESIPPTLLTINQHIHANDIYGFIAELPTGYRTVFNLNVIEGYSHKEIAAMLEISEGTSRSQLYKAKDILKKKLEQEGYNYGT